MIHLESLSRKITNPFWRDVVNGLHSAKQIITVNVQDILNLDILKCVHPDDYQYFIKWKSKG